MVSNGKRVSPLEDPTNWAAVLIHTVNSLYLHYRTVTWDSIGLTTELCVSLWLVWVQLPRYIVWLFYILCDACGRPNREYCHKFSHINIHTYNMNTSLIWTMRETQMPSTCHWFFKFIIRIFLYSGWGLLGIVSLHLFKFSDQLVYRIISITNPYVLFCRPWDHLLTSRVLFVVKIDLQ